MKKQTERLIQTTIHSNPQIIIMGTVSDSSGEVTIDWETSHSVVFAEKPIILAIYPDSVATSETAQPICYHHDWVIDGTDTRLYTGMIVYSEGAGTNIHWAVMGIVKK